MTKGHEGAISPKIPEASASYKAIGSTLSTMGGGAPRTEITVPLSYTSGLIDEPHHGFLSEPASEEIDDLMGDLARLLEPGEQTDQLVVLGAYAKSAVYGAILPWALAQFALESSGGYSIEELRHISEVRERDQKDSLTLRRRTDEEMIEATNALQRTESIRGLVMSMSGRGQANNPARPESQTGLFIYADPEVGLEVTRFGVNPVFPSNTTEPQLTVDIELQGRLDDPEAKDDIAKRMLAVMARMISPTP